LAVRITHLGSAPDSRRGTGIQQGDRRLGEAVGTSVAAQLGRRGDIETMSMIIEAVKRDPPQDIMPDPRGIGELMKVIDDGKETLATVSLSQRSLCFVWE